jgi:hypothetical protein
MPRADFATYSFLIEAMAALAVMATAHLGGFLSGINVPS